MPLVDPALRTSLVAGVTGGETAETNTAYDRINKLVQGWSHRGVVVAASTTAAAFKETADYVCDGTADQTEINTAIATGRPVLQLPGTYNTSGSIVVPVSTGLIWRGSGRGATIINAAASLNVDVVSFTTSGGTGVDRATISDMRFNGNATSQTAGHIINAAGARYSSFQRLFLYRPHSFAIRFGPRADSSFTHHNEVTGCGFEYNTSHTSGDGGGVLMEDSDENMVHHNVFEGMGRSGATRPSAVHDLGGLNSIDHNQIVTGGYGVWLERAHSVVDHNVFDGAGSYSNTAQVRMNGNKNQVSTNRFYNIGFNRTANTADGIYADNTQDNTITGNQFRVISGGSARSGINLDFAPVNNLITGNVFTTFDTPAFATAAITGSLTRNVIRDNLGFTEPGFTTQAGTAYTLALGDTDRAVECTSASPVTVTVPPNSSVAFPVGTLVEVARLGTGSVTVAQGAGVTIRTPGTLVLRTQYSTVSLRKSATDTWVLAGDTT